MHAIISDNGALRWHAVPEVFPGPDEVVIAVVGAGVNRADLLQAAGKYPPPPGASDILGLEVSGVVETVGNRVTTFTVGQPVCALLAGGGYAQRVAVPAAQVMPVPSGVDLLDAAALPEAACTVWSNLVMTADLRVGQWVLVHGGSSGIGTHAIQVIRALGAHVVITAGSPKKLSACRELGADAVISYRDEDFVTRAIEVSGGGVAVVLDIMGAAYLDRNLAALAPDGTLVIIGMQGGIAAELNIAALIGKRLSLVGTALRGRPVDGPHGKAPIVAAVVESVWPMVADGAVRPVIGARLPIEQSGEAHRMLAAGEVIGKVVLTVPS